jgi:hypothetical protein
VRLWSLHPSLLDARGLVALWREGLLARAVLRGRTRGYRRHPQLDRFRGCADPVRAIDAYLWAVRDEAARRGYAFDARKLGPRRAQRRLPVTRGQLAHEKRHLGAKLRARAPRALAGLRRAAAALAHPLFRVVAGPRADWERGDTAGRNMDNVRRRVRAADDGRAPRRKGRKR